MLCWMAACLGPPNIHLCCREWGFGGHVAFLDSRWMPRGLCGASRHQWVEATALQQGACHFPHEAHQALLALCLCFQGRLPAALAWRIPPAAMSRQA